MSDRIGYFMQTFSGRPFWPLDPRAEEVFIEDIAHALSLINRFGGHSKFPYSVAQHSILVSKHCDEADALWGLCHDMSEAYAGDVIRPIKNLPAMAGYIQVEEHIQKVIAEKWGLSPAMPTSVARADLVILATEARDVMGGQTGGDWGLPYDALPDEHIAPMRPERVEELFLSRFEKLLDEHRARAALRALGAAGNSREISARALRGEIGLREAHELIAGKGST
jgi:hypothetical protein